MKPWSQRHALAPSDGSLARAVFLLLLAVYLATFNGLPAGPDGEVSFQTTSALYRTGSLAIGGTPEAEGLIAFAESQPPGGFSVRRGAGDGEPRYYGWFGVAHPIVDLPLYALGHMTARVASATQLLHQSDTRYGVGRSEYFEHLFVGLRNPLLAAWTGLLIVLIARRLGVARSATFAAGLGYGLATFALAQARGWFGDVQGAFALCAAFYLLLVLRERFTRRNAALFGGALALAFLTRVALLPAVLVFDLALVWLARELRHPRFAPQEGTTMKRVFLAAAAPQVFGLALFLLSNQLRFGDPLDSGYDAAMAGGLFGGDPLRAALALLVSPSKGLVWMAPGLLLLGFGGRRALREGEESLVWIVFAVTSAVALPILFFVGWHGAWSYGPRYLLPALPLLWSLAALGFQRSDVDPHLRPLAWAALAMGLLTQLPGALVDTTTYHELAVAAAGERFEVPEEGTDADRAARRFEALQWDWGFGAPWVHWRILRHRVAMANAPGPAAERMPAADLFRWPTQTVLEPAQARERGFEHLAWVDLRKRLDGVVWPGMGLIALLILFGIVASVRGLDP